MKTPLKQTWDLESIFSGGSSSASFHAFLEELESKVQQLQSQLKAAKVPQTALDTERLDSVLSSIQELFNGASQAGSFVSCLTAQNQHDKLAVQLGARVNTLYAQGKSALVSFQNLLAQTSEDIWQKWMEREAIQPISFVLNEYRNEAREKMAPELESLALDLAVDGYHGWGDFYDTIVKNMTIPVPENGEIVNLSVGQAANKLDEADRSVRKDVFARWEEAWTQVEDYCADTLNHLAGFRLKLYEKRGWTDVLKEPLEISRMSAQTLDTMWQVINETKPIVVKYLERKAKAFAGLREAVLA